MLNELISQVLNCTQDRYKNKDYLPKHGISTFELMYLENISFTWESFIITPSAN